jgi:hypothetical protein
MEMCLALAGAWAMGWYFLHAGQSMQDEDVSGTGQCMGNGVVYYLLHAGQSMKDEDVSGTGRCMDNGVVFFACWPVHAG